MNFVEDLPIVEENKVAFHTAILTYPSDYDGLLSVGIITEYLENLFKDRKLPIKCVIAKEEADDKIQRNHFHCYIDSETQLQVRPKKYFDIRLPTTVVVFIHNNKQRTREYRILDDLASELGWDNNSEMLALLASYCRDMDFIDYELLDYAHPNLQVKKRYGSKYCMLRYVVKQKLVARANFDVDKELKYLEKNKDELCIKCNELVQQKLLAELNINTIEECIQLCKLYQKKLQSLKIKERNKKGREFRAWLRDLILNEKYTQKEVMDLIKNNREYWEIYSSNVINYRTLINDMFKHSPPLKPKCNYNDKFYVPIKLYNWIVSLDDWVRRWHQGEVMESRPRGLCLIGPSRIGKTRLMTTIGDFTYICNMWNMDSWETRPAYTIMDDVDPIDNDKGLNFAWFKPFFGGQDIVTVTDKFRPKRDIVNGKPLIWLSNYKLEDVFKRQPDLEYIRKNMEIIYVNRPLYEPPIGMETFQLKEFDPKNTWYYKNVVLPKEQELEEPNDSMDNNDQEDQEEDDNDADELEPLNQRKRRLSIEEEKFEEEKGRPSKQLRTENSSDSGIVESI